MTIGMAAIMASTARIVHSTQLNPRSSRRQSLDRGGSTGDRWNSMSTSLFHVGSPATSAERLDCVLFDPGVEQDVNALRRDRVTHFTAIFCAWWGKGCRLTWVMLATDGEWGRQFWNFADIFAEFFDFYAGDRWIASPQIFRVSRLISWVCFCRPNSKILR